MQASAKPTIPYDKQSGENGNRMCGAACLAMAYSSYGASVSQAEIWPKISKPNRFGSLASTTHLMAQDALQRDFKAIAFQARHPLQVLRICRSNGIRAILNHRLRRDSGTGHYSLLVDMDDSSVVLHDPLLGPSRRLPFKELLELWIPRASNSEITGYTLIALAPKTANGQAETAVCKVCTTAVPPGVKCPGCGQPIHFEPAAAIGCVDTACLGRMWNHVCCPNCDLLCTAGEGPDAPPKAERKAPVASEPDIARFFSEIDKFRDQLLRIPSVAANPDVLAQFDMIEQKRVQFHLEYAELTVSLDARKAEMKATLADARRQEEEQQKKIDEANKPPVPLDGNALNRELLSNLGFTKGNSQLT